MAQEKISLSLKDYKDLLEKVRSYQYAGENIVLLTISDVRSKVNTKMDNAVREVYNLKRGETKKIGGLKQQGDKLDVAKLVYYGRQLIPTEKRFSLKSNPASGKGLPYQMTAEIEKGKTENLPKGTFLAMNKWKKIKRPFQREGGDRYPIESVKTISLPEMIEDTRVSKPAQSEIDALIEERINHHIEEAMKGTPYIFKKPKEYMKSKK